MLCLRSLSFWINPRPTGRRTEEDLVNRLVFSLHSPEFHKSTFYKDYFTKKERKALQEKLIKENKILFYQQFYLKNLGCLSHLFVFSLQSVYLFSIYLVRLSNLFQSVQKVWSLIDAIRRSIGILPLS